MKLLIEQLKVLKPQDAIDRKFFGPVYHGTTQEIEELIEKEGFKIHVGEKGSVGVRHGYELGAYGYNLNNIPAPIHHLGYGIYFTTVKAIAKGFNENRTKLKTYFLDVSRLETINFGAPSTMMKWWIKMGYNPELALRDRVAATKILTETLKNKFDAVWFKGKGLKRLLDGDQIVVFDPNRIYHINFDLARGYEIGSKVKRKSDGMIGFIKGRREIPKEHQEYKNDKFRFEITWKQGGTDYNNRFDDFEPILPYQLELF